MKIYDLSRTITEDLSVWPHDIFKLKKIEIYGFVVDNILETSMHIGTHIDVPLHMIEGGKSVSDYPPQRFIGNGVLLDARGKNKIDIDLLEGKKINKDDIVLILTGCDEKFGSPSYFEEYPVFTEQFAQKLVDLKVSMVGIDSPTPDNKPFDVHKILLSNDILIIEMLTNLHQLLDLKKFSIVALPPKFDTAGSFVRVIALSN